MARTEDTTIAVNLGTGFDTGYSECLNPLNTAKQPIFSISNSASSRKLRPYQSDAIRHWRENKYSSIFAMATGTGKTFTTIQALQQFKQDHGKLQAIIAVPLRSLAEQWQNEIMQAFPSARIVNTSEDSKWRTRLHELREINKTPYATNDLVIITTYASLPNVIECGVNDKMLLIADEMHNLATIRGMKATSASCFKYRLGLSATPERLWWPAESRFLRDIFGDNKFEFGIEDALREGYLVGFYYCPQNIQLSRSEYEMYIELSRRIAKLAQNMGLELPDEELEEMSARQGNGEKDPLSMMLIQRARIKKNARAKIPHAVRQLRSLKQNAKLKRALVYVDNEDFLDNLQDKLNSAYVMTAKYVGDTSNDDRSRVVKSLSDGAIDAVLAIKCLDEGVDIPSASQAFILSSIMDSREYIQRLGRVLRRSDSTGKRFAEIFDYLVVPPSGVVYEDEFERNVVRNMVKNEIRRANFFTRLALNNAEASEQMSDMTYSLGFDFTQDNI